MPNCNFWAGRVFKRNGDEKTGFPRRAESPLGGRGVQSAGAGQALPARASARTKFDFRLKSSSEAVFVVASLGVAPIESESVCMSTMTTAQLREWGRGAYESTKSTSKL